MPYKRGDISNKMDYAKESLRLHEEWKGKIEVEIGRASCRERV